MPFCGHATIALGAALALAYGDGTFALQLNEARITVEGSRAGSTMFAALQSPATRSAPAGKRLVDDALALFSGTADDLDPRLPPGLAGSQCQAPHPGFDQPGETVSDAL